MVLERPRARLAVSIALLAVLAAAGAALLLARGPDDRPVPAKVVAVRAVDFRQHPVERFDGPGYLAWVGGWQMPDGDLMAAYTKAEPRHGDGLARARAPRRVLEAFGFDSFSAARDFWDLDLSVRVRRSGDGGRTWEDVREDAFRALAPHAYSQQPTTALPDGTIIRRVNGDDLRQDPSVPHTAFLQRLRPGADEWSEPQVLLDPRRHTYQITRIKRLRDGRLVATGNAWDVPASTRPADRAGTRSRFLLLASSDDGATWREALTIPAAVGRLRGNEWDTAELPDGDLLALMRTATTADGDDQVLRSAVLRQEGEGWVMRDLRTPPFPMTGHPALLATREGVVLSVATSGVHWTERGSAWRRLEVEGVDRYRSHYYPRPIQTEDGTVHVFSHLGSDHPFHRGRHGILDDSFRIAVRRAGGQAE